ncbi:NADH-quinone oxidoreductase subunit 5 family protein [Flammeovirga agarivorans]|uniref:NADH-quinone oxidoreductase subunit L n=1 Tax=Flammeovirga agarivorans TaxID=2726742 RepID=A0A7X8XWY9_9BACT|nr:NADH-quinone oxidoreductase subunit L [Flammeovirga agarivorans]NLR92731.1 NADH-quinone oxidoreductase subunit L [Flammeovirga agarivorans]
MSFYTFITLVAVTSPLISSVFLTVWKSNKHVDKIGTSFMFLSFLCSTLFFFTSWGGETVGYTLDWLRIGDHNFSVTFSIDNFSALLIAMVSAISLAVHVFSSAYMQGDPQLKRYYALLGGFTFSMFGVLISDHLVFLYLFWELVGFCSYMLIGFWRHKKEAISAAKKAFVINRIGDAGFMVAILCLYSVFDTLSIHDISAQFSSEYFNDPLIFIASIGVVLAAMGKSAQIPFSVWLPDAMQGPTPVSALIHAATMVAAGIYLLIRCFFFLPEETLLIIASIGGITALIGAYAAVTQYDIKKVLAFSTISQLGYMMLAIGVGDPENAGFHLVTHAFFKAGLFLGAGAVIHSMHQVSCDICKGFDAQDIRWMGELRKYMPKTFIGFVICLAGLSGIPFTSGFLSKDAILSSALLRMNDGGAWIIVGVFGFAAAILTAFYCLRLLYHVFIKDLGIANHKVCQDCLVLPKEVPTRMNVPVIILACCSFWFVYTLNPFDTAGSWLQEGLSIVTLDHHSVHFIGLILSLLMVAVGLLSAYFIYFKGVDSSFKKKIKSKFFYRLSYEFFYLNNLYKAGVKSLLFTSRKLESIPHADEHFVNLAIGTSEVVRGFDDKVIDFFVKVFAVGNVVIGHVLAWFDKYIVDGIVKLFTLFMKLLGDIFRKPQGERSQSMIAWSILFIVLVLVFLI